MEIRRTVHFIASIILTGLMWGCSENATAPETLVASRMDPSSAVEFQGTVGTPLTERPTVIVRDQRGMPMAGVPVAFRFAFRSSTVGSVQVETDASGHASPGQWILSTTAGTNFLWATAGRNLTVEFQAVGIAGPPVEILKVSGDEQFAFPGLTLTIPQVVLVRDEHKNPVSGLEVTFAVTSGGGSLSKNVVLTDYQGYAKAEGWTVGSAGAQSLSASVSGLNPTTFTAVIATDPCSTIPLSAQNASLSIDLATFGCTLSDGRLASFFSLKVTESQALKFSIADANFPAVLTLTTKDGVPIGEARDVSPSGALKALIAPGDYIIGVKSASGGARGSYRLSFNSVPETVSGCEEMFITLGTTTTQALEAGDCGRPYSDHFRIYLRTGTKVTVTMSSNDVDNVLYVDDAEGNYIADTHDSAQYDGVYGARVTFTARSTGFYTIQATTEYFPGVYKLRVE